MKTISVSVSSEDYEAFRQAASAGRRSIAHLIREAMAYYRTHRLGDPTPLADLPVFVGHRPLSSLPGREELYTEIFDERGASGE